MEATGQFDTNVTIVGAGPVGMLLAYQLDRLGVDCLIAEQNLHTTRWPKMDLTNCRSMEIFRVLGLADDYRAQPSAVGPDANFDSIFVTSLQGGGRLLGSWSLPSVNQQREYIKKHNDGSQPAEPGQRCSQMIITSRRKITGKFGWKYLGHSEESDGVSASFVDHHGEMHTVRSRYLVGCDGGGSRVRKSAGIKMVGGQIPVRFYLVHFRSRQLAAELPFGRFWHAFPAGAGFLIDQDEKDTFTAHYPLEQDTGDTIDPYDIVYKTIGGCQGRGVISIDEILTHSEWQPSFSVAETYSTDSCRVFLAGDAAHRNPPHGGYGMNSGVVDAIDLAWRLAAMIKGYGGDLLLHAYGTERRPMMIRALERSHRHVLEHVVLGKIYKDNWSLLEAESKEGDDLRVSVKKYIDVSGPETFDRGIDLDLRYESPVIYQDGSSPLPWNVKRYQPSTRPGSRAPHMFLEDGVTSTYDLLDKEWTLFHFPSENDEKGKASEIFHIVSKKLNFPLKRVILTGEDHVRQVWERNIVLVRPDTHVAWRANKAPTEERLVEHILNVVSGKLAFPGYEKPSHGEDGFREIVSNFTENQHNDSSAIMGESVSD